MCGVFLKNVICVIGYYVMNVLMMLIHRLDPKDLIESRRLAAVLYVFDLSVTGLVSYMRQMYCCTAISYRSGAVES